MKPKKRIVAKSVADLYEQAKGLPSKPVGDGSCQLVRRKVAGRILPFCAGECLRRKNCRLFISITGNTIVVECRCA